jgi:hypothetical protein
MRQYLTEDVLPPDGNIVILKVIYWVGSTCNNRLSNHAVGEV